MITSMGNGKVKQLVQWQKKRKERDADGVYLAEGLRMYAEAPREEVQNVYVSESFYRQQQDELHLDGWGRKLEIFADPVFAHASGTVTPQGVLLVMKQKEYRPEQLMGRENPTAGDNQICSGSDGSRIRCRPLLMLLDNLQDPGNLGTILRSGEAAGVTGAILSRDCVDIYNPKVIRSTMGSIYRMPFLYAEDLPEMIGKLREQGIHVYAAHLQGKKSYDQEDYTEGTAFLIGNEGNGLRAETAMAAEVYVRIPMCGKVESLNAAAASTVLMFEAARQRRGSR